MVQLKGVTKIQKIQLFSTNIRKLIVERCEQDGPTKFEKITEMGKILASRLGSPDLCTRTHAAFSLAPTAELGHKEGRLQSENVNNQMGIRAKFLRFTIADAWEEFASVHRVLVVGDQDGA